MSVTYDEYRRARYMADAAADQLLDAIRPSRRGRPSLHPRILLTGMMLSQDGRGMSTISSIHHVLTVELPRELQWDLGILTRDASGETQTLPIDALYQLTKRITGALDYTAVRAPHLADDERAARHGALREFTKQMFQATHIPRPAGADDLTLDGTALWAPEKARKVPAEPVTQEVQHEEDVDGDSTAAATADRPHSDPDAVPSTEPDETAPEDGAAADDASVVPLKPGRGCKGPSDASHGAKTAKNGERVWFYGYDIEMLVRAPEHKADDTTGLKRPEPPLAEDLVVLPASADIVQPCLSMIDRLIADGRRIKGLLVDRHYSYKHYDRWFAQLHARGIRQSADLHKADQGFRDWDGMKIAASWVHCPSTPDRLGVIPALSPNASDEEREQFNTAIDERQAYAAQRLSPMNAEGKVRWVCPALNNTLGCSQHAGSVAAAEMKLLPIVSPPKGPLPKLCTQASVQITVKTVAQKRAMKLYQKEYWGSAKWRRDYGRRTYVEGFFGVLKSDTATGLDRGSYQFVGLPMVTIVAVCAAAVTNMRLLRSWHAETGLGDETHPLLMPDRPFHGFTQLDEESAAALDAGVHATEADTDERAA